VFAWLVVDEGRAGKPLTGSSHFSSHSSLFARVRVTPVRGRDLRLRVSRLLPYVASRSLKTSVSRHYPGLVPLGVHPPGSRQQPDDELSTLANDIHSALPLDGFVVRGACGHLTASLAVQQSDAARSTRVRGRSRRRMCGVIGAGDVNLSGANLSYTRGLRGSQKAPTSAPSNHARALVLTILLGMY
jgi:hypothetical protein